MAVGVVGIDLGMTNARAAWVADGRVVLLETPSGQRHVPAVVGIEASGQLHVGESARNQHLLTPELTATRLRRLLGTSQRVYLDDKGFSPHELVAVVLSQIKEYAEQRLGHAVAAAAIAVPTYFTVAQRQATADAAALAGFRSVKLVLEPVAVALAHGLRPRDLSPEQPLLVYDLGARSCDVTVLARAPEADAWTVRATAGSSQGSEECDQRIVAHLLHLYERDHGLSPRNNRKATARLRLVAEWTKRTLSRLDTTPVHLPALMTVGHTPLDLHVEMSREQLDLLIEDELRKTLDLVEIALRDARLLPSQLHAVLLSGGGAQSPLVALLLSEMLLCRPLAGLPPEEAIARGAALFANG